MSRVALARDSNLKYTVRTKDQFILALAIASLLIYLRTLFRLAETAEGLLGSISTNEVFFATLEFAPVVLAVWILAIWHPGRWVPAQALKHSSQEISEQALVQSI